jgi:SAM-dependent methyltransferase
MPAPAPMKRPLRPGRPAVGLLFAKEQPQKPMGIGGSVRRVFGPLEGPITDLYRAFFVSLDRETRTVRRWWPTARHILEIGCGEGAVCQRLSRLYPEAAITGIDISPRAGRLFRGDRARVTFRVEALEEFAPRHEAVFDLVLLCDVLHHVPWDRHEGILQLVRSMIQPGGGFVFKEWEQRANVAHALNYFSDRILTGDRVRYGTHAHWRQRIESVFGPSSIISESRIPPWPNNILFLVSV